MNPVQILLVEDQLLTAEALKAELESAGYGVCGIAQNYEEAMTMVRTAKPDLALIDIVLEDSELDGIGIALALLRYKEMPIIYLTGNTDQYKRARITNPAAFLEKPYRLKELLFQIDLAIYNFYSGHSSHRINPADPLFLPFNKAHIRVAKEEIRYIKAQGNYSHLYLTNESYKNILSDKKEYGPLLFTFNAGYLFKHLPVNFFQLSRSIIVNVNYIDRVEASGLYLGGDYIPLPEGKHKSLLERLNTIKSR